VTTSAQGEEEFGDFDADTNDLKNIGNKKAKDAKTVPNKTL